jgi:hypothetical protein
MNDKFVLVVTVKIGGEWIFTSEPMTEMWADILLREFILQSEPFAVLRAKKVPVEEKSR